MNTTPTVGDQIILGAVVLLAFALALLFLARRRHLSRLRALWLPAALFALFGVPDALLTLRGTWNAAAREADPFVRAFLSWGGWKGLCAAFIVWILGWALVIDGLETLRSRLPDRLASLVGSGQLYLLYAVALGHLDGLTSWTHAPAAIYRASSGLLTTLARDAPWMLPRAPLGYALYPSLGYALLFATLHATVTGMARRGWLIAPLLGGARGPA